MTCCSGVCDATGRQFGEKRAAKDLERYRTKGPGKTASMLLAGLEAAGLLRSPQGTPSFSKGLDIGTGVGIVVFELLDKGSTHATAVDMSQAYISAASTEA